MHKNFTLNVQRLASQSEDQCEERVLLLLGLQVDDGIFKKFPLPTNPPTNKAGSRDAIASKNY